MRVQASRELSWISDRIGKTLTLDARAIEALDANGVRRGMVAFDAWTPNSVQAHMAVDSPIACRHLLRPTFSYVFEECGRRVMLGSIRATNTKSLGMALRLGFKQTGWVRDGWDDGEDMILVQMRREDCRHLEEHS